MKTTASLACLLACLGPLLFICGCATPANGIAYSHPAKFVEHRGSIFGRGTPLDEVVETLGLPHRQLNDNNWIYRHFSGGSAQAPHDDCNRLLITFSENRVENLTLINAAAERVFAARIQAVSDDAGSLASHEPHGLPDLSGRLPQLR